MSRALNALFFHGRIPSRSVRSQRSQTSQTSNTSNTLQRRTLHFSAAGITIPAPYKINDHGNEDAFAFTTSRPYHLSNERSPRRVNLAEWSTASTSDDAAKDSVLETIFTTQKTSQQSASSKGSTAGNTSASFSSPASATQGLLPRHSLEAVPSHRFISTNGADALASPVRRRIWHTSTDTGGLNDATQVTSCALVADGVGGWRAHNVDSGIYARMLLRSCMHRIVQSDLSPASPHAVDPNNSQKTRTSTRFAIDLLAPATAPNALGGLKGSSTLCGALLTNDGRLHVVNLGDSSMLWMRNGEPIFRAPNVEHAFNFPAQLGVESSDSLVADAMAHSAPARPGDVLVLGTDGLFDNLHESTIVDAVCRAGRNPDPELLADELAAAALSASLDPSHMSPFYEEARRRGYSASIGGKQDDISVLVVLVNDD
eukprot:TRINITY_DN6288_c0_g2_i1.p1 TRINITY_DN6288_c0_g2~~TRINITY_DN6288_c0_g2_i1.p1  ORF type:complete len:429 (+),score=103.21 TRINITY_DN6288_c0_g2_i1:435-1721(+)